MSHYAALDALNLGYESAFSIGKRVGYRVHGRYLRTLLQLAGLVGASPWTALGQVGKLWSRTWDGGGMRVRRTGDKHAKMIVAGTPPCSSAFFRASMSGAVYAGIAPLCRTCVVTEDERRRRSSSFEMNARWE